MKQPRIHPSSQRLSDSAGCTEKRGRSSDLELALIELYFLLALLEVTPHHHECV